jgi:hypothetical protein
MKLTKRFRAQEALEVRDICMNDSANRGDFYHKCRNAFRYGSRDVDQARHNKIMPIVKRQSSFLYAPERIHFWAELPPDELDHVDKVESCADAVTEKWHDSGAAVLACSAIENALICGMTPVSVLPERMTNGDVALVSRMIEPEMFGVWNPAVPDLLQQQAVCYDSWLSKPEIEIRLQMHSPKDRARILQNLESSAPDYVETDRIFVSNYQGINSGNVETGIVMSRLGGQYAYNPMVRVPLYRVSNLFIFDDDIGDWNWFLLSAGETIFDMPIGKVGCPGRLPIITICADMIPNYFWGWSLVDGLILLQEWYSKRIAQMDELFEKILKTPKVGYGIGQMRESKIAAINRPGGYMSVPNPAAKIEELKPVIPESAFTMMEQMSDMFSEAAGMRPALFGKNEPGVRSEGMGNSLLKISASEMTVKALLIEKCIEDWANLILRYEQRFNDSLLPIYGDDGNYSGRMFRLGEMPSSTKIKVDGHSASPIFVEDHTKQAEAMVRAGAMDSETMIEFMNPPMKGLLKKRQKRRVMAQLIAEQQHKLQQQEKRSGKEQK